MIPLSHIHILPPLFRNLAVSPLLTSRPLTADYSMLDEALPSGGVYVTEIGEAGSVPELRLVNETDRPVLLLDGEELIGAKQNRICNLTILAPPRAETIISVSCVEAGRWSWRSQAFSISGNIHFAGSRARKARDVSDSLYRRSAPHAKQDAVWSDISGKLGRLAARSSTAAMSDAFAEFRIELDGFVGALQLPLETVGVAFSLNGRPLGLELFESPGPCAKLAPKLIRSWALDAIEYVDEPGAHAPPKQSEVADFVAGVAAAPSKRFKCVGLGETIRSFNDKITGGALILEDRPIHVMAFSLECLELRQGGNPEKEILCSAG